jgi:RimJ/RimL family protein N-acetyltransferase
MDFLETERLVLRRFEESDAGALYEYLSDPEVVKYEPYDVMTLEECAEVARRRSSETRDVFWAVCLKENGKLIGNVYFAQQEPEEFMTWEIGYVFNSAYHGLGYATEACARVFRYGFEGKNAHRIVAGVNVKNTASWRLLERLRLRRESHQLQCVFFKRDSAGTPIWVDSYEYAILAAEYHQL